MQHTVISQEAFTNKAALWSPGYYVFYGIDLSLSSVDTVIPPTVATCAGVITDLPSVIGYALDQKLMQIGQNYVGSYVILGRVGLLVPNGSLRASTYPLAVRRPPENSELAMSQLQEALLNDVIFIKQ